MNIKTLDIPQIIDSQYKLFSRYVIEERAIPALSDGLKPVQRRALWMAQKYAKNDWVKVAKLAGIVLAIHPHGDTACSDAISNMAQRFCGANNINWLDGKGAFGSKLVGRGNGIAAARYVAVKMSENFKNIMAVDADIIATKPSYDENDVEPVTFLPLIPTVLLNPVQGIAVGFATTIQPRNIKDVIHCQLQYLEGKDFHDIKPYFDGFKGKIERSPNAWRTTGVYKKDGKKIIITELPIGYTREKYVKILDELEEKDIISGYVDECTDDFLFVVTLKQDLSEDDILDKFSLSDDLQENINVIGFDGKIVKLTPKEIIQQFTEWRLKIYFERYKKEFYTNKTDFEYKRDLLKVMVKGIFKKFPDLKKPEIKDLLIEHEIQEKHIDRIIQTPIYKFGKDEIDALRKELEEKKKYLENLVKLCKDESLRKDVYKKELKELK